MVSSDAVQAGCQQCIFNDNLVLPGFLDVISSQPVIVFCDFSQLLAVIHQSHLFVAVKIQKGQQNSLLETKKASSLMFYIVTCHTVVEIKPPFFNKQILRACYKC